MDVKKIIKRVGKGKYVNKDAEKFADITKFIGEGSINSSTHRYAEALAEIANTGEYSADDVVGVSVEGARRNRIPLNKEELLLAIKAEAMIITDTHYHRHRLYNVGEREAEALLLAMGYREQSSQGTWFKKQHV